MSPLEYCYEKIEDSEFAFKASYRFLPKAQYDAIAVVYAYRRELLEVIQDCQQAEVAKATLAWWHQDLAKVFQYEMPEHPVHQALKDVVAVFRLPENELVELIHGVEMDIHHVRYLAFDDLRYYCQRISGVLLRLVARILGFTDEQTLAYAETLGIAVQLTKIMTHIGADARLGRIYLPMDELQRFNVPAQTILSSKPTAEFEALMNTQLERIQQFYQQALSLLPKQDKKQQKASLMLASIYDALLMELKDDGVGNVLKYKLTIPYPRQFRIALKTRWFGFHL